MKSPTSRGLFTGFAMVFVTLLATAIVGYLNVRRLYDHDRSVNHAHEVLSELRLLQGTVADAESGMQGYIITQDATYLKAYDAAAVSIPQSLNNIERLTRGNSRQVAGLADLRKQIRQRMSFMEQTVRATRDQGAAAGRAQVARGEGRAAMERVRDGIRSLEQEESLLLDQRVNEANISFWTATVSCVIMAVIGLALIALGYRWTYRDLQAREARAQELKSLNEQLEERVRERTAALSTANIVLQEEIAERQRAEHEARLIADELARSNHELAEFAAVASHDLKEPLRKIQAFGDRLYGQVHDELSAKGRDYLNRILASAARMRQLIDGLLEYSRVSSGPPPLTLVDLRQVASDVVHDLESQIQQTHAEIEVGELPTIAADAVQMQQLLQNLISNALKFHRPDEPPHVCISGRVVADSGSNGHSQADFACVLTVEDNGVGFDPDYSDEIFGMFHRLHRRDQFEGTGMGLAICKKICERHHGTIAATSKPGQGSRFVVSLPLTPPSLAATA
jgi:signal transduction histidine kinase